MDGEVAELYTHELYRLTKELGTSSFLERLSVEQPAVQEAVAKRLLSIIQMERRDELLRRALTNIVAHSRRK